MLMIRALLCGEKIDREKLPPSLARPPKHIFNGGRELARR
jgi:hypothetical protein